MIEETVKCHCENGAMIDYDPYLKMVMKDVCGHCRGTGFTKRRIYRTPVQCPTCKGTGKVQYPVIIGGPDETHKCPDCRGKGIVFEYDT